MSSTYVSRYSDGRFTYRSNYPVSPTELGQDIIVGVMKHLPWTDFGLEPWFAVEALRQCGRTGKLNFDIQADDPLGVDVTRAEALREKALELECTAHSLDDSEVNKRCPEFGNKRLSVTLLQAADRLRREAAAIQPLRISNGPLAALYSMPRVRKARGDRTGKKMIVWDRRARVWSFGGYRVSVKQLGRIVALSLLRGRENVVIGDIAVSVNYLLEMARITGSHDRFRENTAGKQFSVLAPSNLAAQVSRRK